MLSDVSPGDKVKSVLSGEGEVSRIFKDGYVQIKFGNRYKYYLPDGRKDHEDLHPEIVEVEKRKWEPEGGEAVIDLNGDIIKRPANNTIIKEGRAYPSRELAEKAYSLIRPYQRLVAWVLENYPNYEPERCHWVVYYDNVDKKWAYCRNGDYFKGIEVRMPEFLAARLDEKLNDGEVEL